MSFPDTFTKIEYIEFTGQQCINIGFNPNNNTRITVDLLPYGITQTGLWCVFGCRQGSQYYELYNASTNDTNLYWLWGTTLGKAFTPDYTKRQIFEVNKNTSTVGNSTLEYDNESFQMGIPLYLMADNNNGSIASNASGYMYSCQVYDNDVLIRDYIPCKNDLGVAGLYDLTNDVFYGNIGSGSIVAGPDLPPDEPQEVDFDFTTLITDRENADVSTVIELLNKGLSNMSSEEIEIFMSQLKGAYNYTDFNRVETAVANLCWRFYTLPTSIAEYVSSNGLDWLEIYDVPYDPSDILSIQTKMDWDQNDEVSEYYANRYINNVLFLKNLIEHDSVSVISTISNLDVENANAIEKELYLLNDACNNLENNIKTLIDNTKKTWYYSGEVYCGEVI